jgi:predicted lipid-binding transport protein (Tim44 family)
VGQRPTHHLRLVDDAWLLSRWRWMWVPMVVHAGLNLGWMFAALSGGAGGGGLLENLLRAATITIASGWTIRVTRAHARGTEVHHATMHTPATVLPLPSSTSACRRLLTTSSAE